jgi:hypothetical protein
LITHRVHSGQREKGYSLREPRSFSHSMGWRESTMVIVALLLMCSCSKAGEQLVRSCRLGDTVVVDQLLRSGADPDARIDDYPVAKVVAIAWIAICVVAMSRWVRRRGVLELDPREANLHTPVSRSERLITRIQHGEDSAAGADVLRCRDFAWQGVTTRLIASAGLVIVDVTVPSVNVLWEVEQTLAWLPAVVAVEELAAPHRRPTVRRLRARTGPGRASLERDREDALALLEMRGLRTGDIAEERMNRGKTDIAGGGPLRRDSSVSVGNSRIMSGAIASSSRATDVPGYTRQPSDRSGGRRCV